MEWVTQYVSSFKPNQLRADAGLSNGKTHPKGSPENNGASDAGPPAVNQGSVGMIIFYRPSQGFVTVNDNRPDQLVGSGGILSIDGHPFDRFDVAAVGSGPITLLAEVGHKMVIGRAAGGAKAKNKKRCA